MRGQTTEVISMTRMIRRISFVVFAAMLFGIEAPTANAGQVIQTPCGLLNQQTGKAINETAFRQAVYANHLCNEWFHRTYQLALQERGMEQRFRLADRQMTQAELNATTQRQLAERQMQLRERAATTEINRREMETTIGAIGAAVRIGQVIQGWGR